MYVSLCSSYKIAVAGNIKWLEGDERPNHRQGGRRCSEDESARTQEIDSNLQCVTVYLPEADKMKIAPFLSSCSDGLDMP